METAGNPFSLIVTVIGLSIILFMVMAYLFRGRSKKSLFRSRKKNKGLDPLIWVIILIIFLIFILTPLFSWVA